MKCWVGVRAWDFGDDHFARHQAVAAAAEEESPSGISEPSEPSKPSGPLQRASEWSNVESEEAKAGWDRCIKTASIG